MLRNTWNYLCIGMGGAIGTMLRFWVADAFAHAFGGSFPLGTLVINVTGSFVIAFFAALTGLNGRMIVSPLSSQFFMVGICGGYTTFSSFSLQTLNLAREGQWGYAAVNVGLSVVLCLGGAWLGFLAGQSLNR